MTVRTEAPPPCFLSSETEAIYIKSTALFSKPLRLTGFLNSPISLGCQLGVYDGVMSLGYRSLYLVGLEPVFLLDGRCEARREAPRFISLTVNR